MEIIIFIAVLSHFLYPFLKFLKNWFLNGRKNTVKLKTEVIFALYLKDYLVMPIIIILLFYYTFLATNYEILKLNFPFWIKSIGLLISLASLALKFWAYKTLGKNWSEKIAIYETHQLVTTGPYRIIRHPVYSAYLLVFLGGFLVNGNIIIILLGIIYFLINIFRCNQEEKELYFTFQESFLEYKKQVSKFFPKIF